jgi:RHS repeat-associated protein
VSNTWSNSFAYDGLQRRRIERDYTWNGGWLETNEVHFVYDGNLVFQERDSNNFPLTTYTRGIDKSASLQDGGGIGGLLARSDRQQIVPLIFFPNNPRTQNVVTSYYHSDGNGNITALVQPSGFPIAIYNYDPFGNMIYMGGLLAAQNKYRFSSKEWNDNSGLYYYGYRFYDPNLQRWLNRDPIEESGGLNIYAFAYNNPVSLVDLRGLCNVSANAPPVPDSPSLARVPGLTTPAEDAAAVDGLAAEAGVGLGTVAGLAVAVPAAVGFVSADVYQAVQSHKLNNQTAQANQLTNQKRNDYDAYKKQCEDIDPPPGQTPCEYAQWQLDRKTKCRDMRQSFTDKYYNGKYDWGHQHYMDRLNSEINALQEWIDENCN